MKVGYGKVKVKVAQKASTDNKTRGSGEWVVLDPPSSNFTLYIGTESQKTGLRNIFVGLFDEKGVLFVLICCFVDDLFESFVMSLSISCFRSRLAGVARPPGTRQYISPIVNGLDDVFKTKESRERAVAITSFYNQPAIEHAAAQVSWH